MNTVLFVNETIGFSENLFLDNHYQQSEYCAGRIHLHNYSCVFGKRNFSMVRFHKLLEIPKLEHHLQLIWELSSASPKLHQLTELVLLVLSLVTMKVMVTSCQNWEKNWRNIITLIDVKLRFLPSHLEKIMGQTCTTSPVTH